MMIKHKKSNAEKTEFRGRTNLIFSEIAPKTPPLNLLNVGLHHYTRRERVLRSSGVGRSVALRRNHKKTLTLPSANYAAIVRLLVSAFAVLLTFSLSPAPWENSSSSTECTRPIDHLRIDLTAGLSAESWSASWQVYSGISSEHTDSAVKGCCACAFCCVRFRSVGTAKTLHCQTYGATIACTRIGKHVKTHSTMVPAFVLARASRWTFSPKSETRPEMVVQLVRRLAVQPP
eukprot:2626499-Rhodomonas_salina.4